MSYFTDLRDQLERGAGIATGQDAAKTAGTLIRQETAPAPAIPQSTAGIRGTFAALPAAASSALKRNIFGVPAGYVVLAAGFLGVLALAMSRRR